MYNINLYTRPYHTEDLSKYKFLITGGAGFIGSNLVEYLIKYGAGHVRVLDNLSNGYFENIRDFVGLDNFEFIEGDIRNLEICQQVTQDIDFVSHQAALGSVPRSIKDPLLSNDVNVSGFLNVLYAAKETPSLKRFIYAASSSTYGDHPDLPKVENKIGKPLSPYAVTKFVNELYADVFSKIYGINTVGLRYFNVFGPKQSPDNPYAAVIPLFIKAVKKNEATTIFGDGNQTRDFTFIENVVQANIKSFFASDNQALNQVYNIACGENISINLLWSLINQISGKDIAPNYMPKRIGDVLNSLADISKAKKMIDYQPGFSVKDGLKILIGQKT
jgi:UDP-N-acetylglucosamine 4-epimerase